MVLPLFVLYLIVELAVVVALVSTIGFGWTVLAVLATFFAGLVLAGSQVKRQFQRLRTGLVGGGARDHLGAAADSVLVAAGTVLVVIPGLASTAVGALLLLPPTRAVLRPAATALAARRVPLITVVDYPRRRPDYIDGEVIDRQVIDGQVIDDEVVDTVPDQPRPDQFRPDQPRLPRAE